jgi:hypothetical protein
MSTASTPTSPHKHRYSRSQHFRDCPIPLISPVKDAVSFSARKVVELLIVHLQRKGCSTLGQTMFQRVRIAGQVLPGYLPKIPSQDLPSFLYANKCCSSRSNHRLCLLVRERPCSSSLKPLSSSFARQLTPLRYKSLGTHGFACYVRVGYSKDVVRSVPLLQQHYTFNFVEYYTCIAPRVRCRRAA